MANITHQKHLCNKKTINLGAFYTPKKLIDITYKLLQKHVDISQTTLLDTSCGYGDFLLNKASKEIGADIDEKCKMLTINALDNPSRIKYGILDNEKLVIVGNPPYNDTTSQINYKLKNKHCFKIDEDLKSRDYGISFLKSYVKLNPDFIAILHPLSYLIKKTNFNALKEFTKNYILIDSLVVSSKYFTNNNEFPIVIAIYTKGSMNYEYIKKWEFVTEENTKFSLCSFDYIGNYIDKYPNKNKVGDDYVGCFYTLRDINALKRNKTFLDKPNANTVYIKKEQLDYYKYVDIFKNEICKKLPYYFGNLDIIIDKIKFDKIKHEFFNNKNIRDEYFNCIFEKYFIRRFSNMIEVNCYDKYINVPIPLTVVQSKIRVKIRNTFTDYGEPTAPKQIPFGLTHYIEWQIGYDTPVGDDKIILTSCKDDKFHFIGANGETKTLYELSEYLYYFKQFGFIDNSTINNLIEYLTRLNKNEFIENKLKISRDMFFHCNIAGVNFMESLVKYPILIYQITENDALEIVIREKQKAVGIQAMLYYCFPALYLKTRVPLLGRCANIKEIAILTIDRSNYKIFVEMIKIFGILSEQHNKDVIEILTVLKRLKF